MDRSLIVLARWLDKANKLTQTKVWYSFDENSDVPTLCVQDGEIDVIFDGGKYHATLWKHYPGTLTNPPDSVPQLQYSSSSPAHIAGKVLEWWMKLSLDWALEALDYAWNEERFEGRREYD